MSGVKISALPSAGAVGDEDVVPIIQNGVTVKASASQIKSYVGAGSGGGASEGAGPTVYFGAFAPEALHNDGDLYFLTSSTPYAGYVQNTVATSAGGSPTIVQHAANWTNTGTANPVLPATPTPGNLVLCWIISPGNGSATTSAGWTDAGIVAGNAETSSIYLAYRYVQESDGASLPPVNNTGSDGTWIVAEISGVPETWAATFGADTIGSGANTTAMSAVAAGELGVLVWGSGLEVYSGSASTISGAGWTQDEVGPTATQSYGLAHSALASPGDALSVATINPTISFMNILLKGVGSSSTTQQWVRFN